MAFDPVSGPATPSSARGDAAADLAAALKPASSGRLASGASWRIGPNQPFFLRHHPEEWDLAEEGLDGPTLVPVVHKQYIQPGAGLVRTRRQHEPPESAYRNAVTEAQRAGLAYLDPTTEIPASCLPAGVPAGGYMREVACVDPLTGASGTYYAEPWEVPVATSGGGRQRIKWDRAAHNRWLVHLVESGQIAPPPAGVVDAKIRAASGHLRYARAMRVPEDLRQELVGEKAKRLDKLKSAKAPKAGGGKAKVSRSAEAAV